MDRRLQQQQQQRETPTTAASMESVPRHREPWILKSALKINYAFPHRPDPSAAAGEPEPTLPNRRKRRWANVYDAVAGRVTSTHSLQAVKARPALALGNPMSSREVRLTPEEVYSRRKGAPARYEEFDAYFARGTDRLSGGRRELPGSDLVKAAHAYAARFYEAKAAERDLARIAAGKRPRGFKGGRLLDERTMDETALLAVGLLLEEAGLEALEGRGDLVFLEPPAEEARSFAHLPPRAQYAEVAPPVTPLPVADPFAAPDPRREPARPPVLRTAAAVARAEARSRRRLGGDESQSLQFRRQYPRHTKRRKLEGGSSTPGA